jgi:YaiO family outer membrane protein
MKFKYIFLFFLITQFKFSIGSSDSLTNKNRIVTDLITEYYNNFDKIQLYNGIGYSRIVDKNLYSTKLTYINTIIDSEVSESDFAYSIEMYQNLPFDSYFWVNYNYSKGKIIPNHKFYFQIYKNLPLGFVPNAGFRYMRAENINSISNIYIYTFGLEKYYGRYWLSINNYFYRENNENIFSFNAEARMFYNNEKSHISVKSGIGNITSNFANEDRGYLKDKNAFISSEIKHRLNSRYYIKSYGIIDFNSTEILKYTFAFYLGIEF